MGVSLGTKFDDGFRGDRPVAGAAFGVEEAEEFLKGISVGGVPEVGAFAPDADEAFVLELFEMVGKGGAGDAEFGADFTDGEAIGMGGEEEAENAEAGFGAHGGEHVGEAGDLVIGGFGWHGVLPYFDNNRNTEVGKEFFSVRRAG